MTLIDWEAVQIGDILRLGGFAYEVLPNDESHQGLGPSRITVRKPDGDLFTNRRPTGPVERIFSASEAMDNAESVVVTRLGGVVSGRKRPDGAWTMPESYPDPGSLLAHLMIAHGVTDWSGIESIESLREITKYHAGKHDPSAKKGDEFLPHVHDPQFLGSTDVRQPS